jgi:hypothetical protein
VSHSIKVYNLGQLHGLQHHVVGAMERLPDCTLRSANRQLLEKLEKEIQQREAVLRAQLGDDDDDDDGGGSDGDDDDDDEEEDEDEEDDDDDDEHQKVVSTADDSDKNQSQ